MSGEMDVRACPRCGGEIKAVAKICKHCKCNLPPIETPPIGHSQTARSPQSTSSGSARSNTQGTANEGPVGLIHELRIFMTARGIVKPEQFDTVAREAPGVGLEPTFEQLVARGVLTLMQVESIRDAFRTERFNALQGVLQSTVSRGLLTEEHSQRARDGYGAVVFQHTLREYLVKNGYLTALQADTYMQNQISGRTEVISDPTPHYANGPGQSSTRVNSETNGSRSVPVNTQATAHPDGSSAMSSVADIFKGMPLQFRVLAAILALTALGAAIKVIRDPGRLPVLDTDPECTMNGYGQGSCVFTNRGTENAGMCGRVVATCTPRGRTSEFRESPRFCSGELHPNETRTRSFTVPEFDMISNRAVGWGGDWRNVCQHAWQAGW